MGSARGRFRVAGSVVAITGASAGIGAATARLLAARGASVVLLARRVDRLRELLASLPEPARHRALACDVTHVGSVERAFGDAGTAFGRIDAVVLNAGIGAFARVDRTGEEALRAVVETNLCGVVRCIREAAPWLRRARDRAGRIVLVSSIAGRRGFPGLGVYSATKWALHGLADALRVELAEDGIATSLVAPGRTETEFESAALREESGVRSPESGGEETRAATSAIEVAEAIVSALESAPVVTYPGRPGFLVSLANLLVPRWFDRRTARVWRGR